VGDLGKVGNGNHTGRLRYASPGIATCWDEGTNLIVAERFGKRHKHVLEEVGNLECSEEFRVGNFSLSSHTNF
jgi:hypothetical protein